MTILAEASVAPMGTRPAGDLAELPARARELPVFGLATSGLYILAGASSCGMSSFLRYCYAMTALSSGATVAALTYETAAPWRGALSEAYGMLGLEGVRVDDGFAVGTATEEAVLWALGARAELVIIDHAEALRPPGERAPLVNDAAICWRQAVAGVSPSSGAGFHAPARGAGGPCVLLGFAPSPGDDAAKSPLTWPSLQAFSRLADATLWLKREPDTSGPVGVLDADDPMTSVKQARASWGTVVGIREGAQMRVDLVRARWAPRYRDAVLGFRGPSHPLLPRGSA